jgi:hypothetical protein
VSLSSYGSLSPADSSNDCTYEWLFMMPQTLFTSWSPYSSLEHSGQSTIVAYFSMEIAITPAMPTYSGGLGVLAGDTLRCPALASVIAAQSPIADKPRLPGTASVPSTTNVPRQRYPAREKEL